MVTLNPLPKRRGAFFMAGTFQTFLIQMSVSLSNSLLGWPNQWGFRVLKYQTAADSGRGSPSTRAFRRLAESFHLSWPIARSIVSLPSLRKYSQQDRFLRRTCLIIWSGPHLI